MNHQMQGQAFMLVKLLLISAFLFGYSSCLKLGETCSTKSDKCEAGLNCGTCSANGNTRPRCTRTQPIIPTNKIKGLPFNKYSWLTTHNSYARAGSKKGPGTSMLAPANQDDTVIDQLKNGVRGLMLDMYDFEDGIYLCHSFGGVCYNATAFQRASDVLKDIQGFLKDNPSEIVTIFIEDYVKYPRFLQNLFNSTGLSEYMFPMSKMPRNGKDWPTVDEMIEKNQRLVVFSSKSSKEGSDGIAYEWNFVVENQYGNDGMRPGICQNRGESAPMSTAARPLVLMNYFPTNPSGTGACAHNSAQQLIGMMKTCYGADGRRWPNFIAVDFYKRSDGGGAAQAVDEANGHLTCGCDTIAYCRANATFGTCDVPVLAPPPPAQLEGAAPGPDNDSTMRQPLKLRWLILAILSVLLLWLL